MKKIIVKVEFTEPMLGMSPSEEGMLEAFQALREKKLQKKYAAIEEKCREEKAVLQATLEEMQNDARENGLSIFPRNEEGIPILWDYQIRGFFKDNMKAMKDTKVASYSLFKKQPSTVVDRGVFVTPRQIKLQLPEGEEVGRCERILRREDFQKGGKISTNIKVSECVPPGTTARFAVHVADSTMEKYVLEALEYGIVRGFGEWRNSGKGTFRFSIYNENTKEWEPQKSQFEIDEELPE